MLVLQSALLLKLRPNTMAVTRGSKKRQTHLTFHPIPTSSPQASQLSETVRSRAAAVSFRGASPSKKQIIECEGSSNSSPLGALRKRKSPQEEVITLPTPQPTSDVSEEDDTGIEPSFSQPPSSAVYLRRLYSILLCWEKGARPSSKLVGSSVG